MDAQCKQKVEYWVISGLLLQVTGGVIFMIWETLPIELLAVALFWVGIGLFSVGLAFYAKGKGYNLAWGLAGILSLVGLILLALLQDKSQLGGSEKPANIPFVRQAARASWVAPLLACIISYIHSLTDYKEPPEGNKVIIAVLLLFIVAGLALGIIAILGTRKHGRNGIMKPAIIGIVVNLFFILLVVSLFVGATRESSSENRQLALDAFLKYPSWYGTTKLQDTIVTVSSLNDSSQVARGLNMNFMMNVSVLFIRVDNSAGKNKLTVDPSSLRLNVADEKVQPSLPTRTVLQTAKKNKEKLLKQYSGPFQIASGEQLTQCIAFIPYGFDMSKVISISLLVDGHDILVKGAYMTSAQKAQNLMK